MSKKGLLKWNDMGDYEKQQGYASYRTIVEHFIGDAVLCNKLPEVDPSIWDNINCNNSSEEDDEETTFPEIFQYFLCNISDFDKDICLSAGLILSYSDLLECDVLMVDHWGTSWDYVLTDIKLFDDYEELQKYEEDEETGDEE